MKVKLNQPVKGIKGEPLKDEKQHLITMIDLCIDSILTPVQGDDEKKKFEKYEIYKKLRDAKGGEVELKLEELNLIKNAVGKTKPPLVMGQIWEVLEGK